MLKKTLLFLVLFPCNDFCVPKTSKINLSKKAKLALGTIIGTTGLALSAAGLHLKYPRLYASLKAKFFKRTWQEELRYMLTPPRRGISIEEHIWNLEFNPQGLPSKVGRYIVSGKLKEIPASIIAKIRPEFFKVLLNYVPLPAKQGDTSKDFTKEQIQKFPNGWYEYVSNNGIEPASYSLKLPASWPDWLTNMQMTILANGGWFKRTNNLLRNASRQQREAWLKITEQKGWLHKDKKTGITEKESSQFIKSLQEKDKASWEDPVKNPGMQIVWKTIVLPVVQKSYHGLEDKAEEFYKKYPNPEVKSKIAECLLFANDLQCLGISERLTQDQIKHIQKILLIDFLDSNIVPTFNTQQLKQIDLRMLLPKQLAKLTVNQLQDLAKNGWLFRQLEYNGNLLNHFTEEQLKSVFDSYNIWILSRINMFEQDGSLFPIFGYGLFGKYQGNFQHNAQNTSLLFKPQLNDRTLQLWEQFEKKFNVLQRAIAMENSKTPIAITKNQMQILGFTNAHNGGWQEEKIVVDNFKYILLKIRGGYYEKYNADFLANYLRSLDDISLNSLELKKDKIDSWIAENSYPRQTIQCLIADTFYQIIKKNYDTI